MSSRESAGTLLYRRRDEDVAVLLVHASGNYNRKAPWSIPKGLPEAGESLDDAARRETLEETGVVAGELVYLGYVDYSRSRKRVHCFAGEAPEAADPHCASWEVDRAEFVEIEAAATLLHGDQKAFLTRLLEYLVSGQLPDVS